MSPEVQPRSAKGSAGLCDSRRREGRPATEVVARTAKPRVSSGRCSRSQHRPRPARPRPSFLPGLSPTPGRARPASPRRNHAVPRGHSHAPSPSLPGRQCLPESGHQALSPSSVKDQRPPRQAGAAPTPSRPSPCRLSCLALSLSSAATLASLHWASTRDSRPRVLRPTHPPIAAHASFSPHDRGPQMNSREGGPATRRSQPQLPAAKNPAQESPRPPGRRTARRRKSGLADRSHCSGKRNPICS